MPRKFYSRFQFKTVLEKDILNLLQASRLLFTAYTKMQISRGSISARALFSHNKTWSDYDIDTIATRFKGTFLRLELYIQTVHTDRLLVDLTYYFVPNCRGGSNKMHHGGNYQHFLKLWAGGWGFFRQNLQFDSPLLLRTKE